MLADFEITSEIKLAFDGDQSDIRAQDYEEIASTFLKNYDLKSEHLQLWLLRLGELIALQT